LIGLALWIGACAAPTFTDVRDDILLPSCSLGTSCHSEGAGGLTLTADGAYDALVGVASADADGEILVIAGDADNSYLIKKVEWADGITGEGMPLGTTLDPDLSDELRAWIDAGAEND
jgi:hypothetical protein